MKKISDLQSALRAAAEPMKETDKEAVLALVDALETHKDSSVVALIKKLPTIVVRDAKPKAPRKTSSAGVKRIRPTKAQLAEASVKYGDQIREHFYNDDAFRKLMEQMEADPHLNKDGAIGLFEAFFGEYAFDKKGTKKPFVLRQIREHRNTQALREGRIDVAPQ